jgi:hypothetical protein
MEPKVPDIYDVQNETIRSLRDELEKLKERLAGAKRVQIRRESDGSLGLYDHGREPRIGHDIGPLHPQMFIILPDDRE